MANQFDAIIVGGGHNGLVAAAYLAKAGKSALVLERRDVLGGIAVTEELVPGFHFSALADGAGPLAPEVIRDLDLVRHGLEIVHADPLICAPQPDGSTLTIWRDTDKTAQEIARFSEADARAYPDFLKALAVAADFVAGLNRALPPEVPDVKAADLAGLVPLGMSAARKGPRQMVEIARLMPMSVYDLLNEWFESDAVKGAIAATGIANLTFGPRASGSAYLLIYQASLAGGLFRSADFVRGGMGALSQAIAKSAEANGAKIRTGAEVASILVRDQRAVGVRLASGEEIGARAVIASTDPRSTFETLIDPAVLERRFRWRVSNVKYRGSTARLHLALDGLPDVAGLNGSRESLLRGHLLIAPGVDYLERAYDHVKYGRWSEQPYLDVTIPSLTDPGLAPNGQHVMSISVQYAPYHLRGRDWDSLRDDFADHVIAALSRYAPDLSKHVLGRHVITPLDMERTYGLPEGNWNHGEMSLDQFLYMRPIPGYARYRGPLDGLFLCGAGAHPGGGVTGLPGHNAAREILRSVI